VDAQGIIRWFLNGEALADVVCDTTDIRRDPTPYVPILGIFFFHNGHAECASKEVADLMPLAVLA
jgi:hypothetical protein